MSTRDDIRWQDLGRCNDYSLDLFFPVGETGDAAEQIQEAKNICRTCLVRYDCLMSAVANREHGVWGATTEAERSTIKRHMAKVPYSDAATFAYALDIEMPLCIRCDDHAKLSAEGVCRRCLTEQIDAERAALEQLELPSPEDMCTSAEGCQRVIFRKGLCVAHHSRAAREADPDKYRARKRSAAARKREMAAKQRRRAAKKAAKRDAQCQN